MANTDEMTERLIAAARLGDDTALNSLINQIGPLLRRAVDAELQAVQHDLDAAKIWDEIKDEVKRHIGVLDGTTEAEFAAWAERLALRHIRYSLGGRAANIETIAPVAEAETLVKPTPATNPDPNATLAPDKPAPPDFDPNATLAPGDNDTAKLDPDATIRPGQSDTIAPTALKTPGHDPHATITDLAAIPLAPQTTKIFGDYEILETIAKGGMGVVYKARQRKLNRIVALKMILAGQFADQEDIERFYIEAEAAAQLRHPNIVGIFEVGECEGQHYFSMEYIEGQSLGDLVREHPLPPRGAATFVKTISEAMHYAHQKGVLHRDLKPSNVLVDNQKEPLITDFGLAKRTEEQSVRTVAGSVLGTPSYMPPEQASGKLDLISERSDVYSIGAILYELITGKPPFGAANPWETIKQVINNEPVSPRLLNNTVPADLETICLKCLQKDQARRYTTAQDLADELQRFLAGQPILARPIGVVERSVRWCYRNPWPTVALGVLLLGVVGTSVSLGLAVVAQRKAEVEKGKAEVARDDARNSEAEAVAAKDQAEMSRDQLLAAINELFTAWGDVKLLNEPGFDDVREQLLETAKNLYERMDEQLGDDPKIQVGLGEAYYRLGRMMYHLRSYEDAEESLRAAQKIQALLHADQPDDETRLQALGESLNQLGKVLEVNAVDLSELDNAEAVYVQTIAARESLLHIDDDNQGYRRELLNTQMNQAVVWQRKADLLADQGQREQAERYYLDAKTRVAEIQGDRRDLLERLGATNDAQRDLMKDLAEGYFNLANVCFELEELEATGEHVAAAVETFETLRALDEKDLELQYNQALCLILGGDAKFAQKLHEPVLADFANAKEIFKRLKPDGSSSLSSESKGVPKYRRGLGQVYIRMGDVYRVASRYTEALAEYRAAETSFEDLIEDFQDDTYRRDLVTVSVKIGEALLEQGQIEQALAAYEKVEQTLKNIDDEFAQSDLVPIYVQLGEIQFTRKQYELAVESFQSAKELLAAFIDEFQDDWDRQELARVLLRIGDAHKQQKLREQALEAYQAALKILTPMVAAAPADEELKDMLAEANNGIANLTAETVKPSSAVPLEEAN